MKTLKIWASALIIGLTLNSCDLFKAKDLTQKDGIELIKKETTKFIDNVDDYKVYDVKFTGKTLENDIVSIEIVHDKNGKPMNKQMYLENTGRGNETPARNAEKYVGVKTKLFKDIDFAGIQANILKAVEMTEKNDANLEFKSTFIYTVSMNPSGGADIHNFTLNFTDKTESTKVKGKKITTNYYSVSFTTINGSVEVKA